MMDANSDNRPHQNSHHHENQRRPLQHEKPTFRKQKAIQIHSTSSDESGERDGCEISFEASIVADTDAIRTNNIRRTNLIIMNDNNQPPPPSHTPEPLPRTQIRFNVFDTDHSSEQSRVSSTSNQSSWATATTMVKPMADEADSSTLSPSTSDTLIQSDSFESPNIRSQKIISSRGSQNIPNVFFSRLNTIDDDDDGDDHRNNLSNTGSRNIENDQALDTKNLPNIPSIHMLNPINIINNNNESDQSNDLTSRSASSSPRIGRQNRSRALCPGQLIESLIVPSSGLTRKLSLQPIGNQLNNNQSIHQQQHQPQMHMNFGSSGIGSQNNLLYQNGLGSPATNAGGSVSSVNNLTVNSSHLIPRKSVIGRLERSSFQTQRLSDVGVAFGQQLTAKMGLKLPASQERIVEQTRWLYLRYVFVKLRQNALPLRDLNLTKSSRARRAAALGESTVALSNISDRLVSSSAPATAAAINTDAITSPFYSGSGAGGSTSGSNVPSAKSSCRKRTAISDDINTQDLAMLAAKLRNDETSPPIISNGSSNHDPNTYYAGSENHPAGLPVSNKKFIMDPTINNQIFTVIWNIIRELRELKPEFYGDTIYELIGMEKFSSIQTLLDVQMTICQEMTRSEISWCRISALFSLFGAMSLDCVRLGTPEHVGPILDGFIEFVERDLALWISQQGGWESFLYKYRAGFRVGQLSSKIITIALPVFIWVILTMFKSAD